MATNLDIVLRVNVSEAGKLSIAAQNIKQVGEETARASEKAKAASGGFSAFASKVDSAGRQARIGLSSMAQAADLVGVNLSGVIGPAAAAADAIGDMVGAVGSLGTLAGGIGLVIAALGAAKFALDQYNKSIADNIMYTSRYLQDAHMIAAGNAALAQSFNQLKQAMIESQQIGMDDFIRGVPQLREMNNALLMVGLGVKDLDVALAEIKTQWEVVSSASTQVYNDLEALREKTHMVSAEARDHAAAERERANALDYAAAAARGVSESLGDTRGEAIADYREGARSIAEMNSKAWLATHEFKEGAGWVEKIGTNAAKASTSISQMASKLKGLVEGALTPTAADPNMGDAWDEARKRFEAFATGTDLGAYGEDFRKMFEGLGMSAQAAADAFKNFSLFANPENIKLVDMAPIIESVKTQLDSMIGKANLTAAAMKEVWANLSPAQKAALAEQGIDNASEAITALVDPTSQAKTQVQQLGDAIGAIPSVVTTTFNVVKDAAETAIQEFKAVLDDFIARYSNVTISINAETSAVEPTATTAPPPAGPPSGNYATGLDFIVPPGFPNDSYGFRGNLTSGERVTVTPAGKTDAGGGPNIIVYVMDENGQMRRARKIRAMAAMGA